MAVYVDEIRDWTLIARARRLRHTHWCHLTADTEDELHAFAARLGLRRSWFQKKSDRDYRWHYDLVPTKRAHAVRLGAREVDRRFIGQLMIRRQEERDGAERGATVGPRCGNNPNAPLTPGDQRVVDEFRAYLAERQPPPVHKGGNADDCPACQAQGLHTIGHPYECPGPDTAGAGD